MWDDDYSQLSADAGRVAADDARTLRLVALPWSGDAEAEELSAGEPAAGVPRAAAAPAAVAAELVAVPPQVLCALSAALGVLLFSRFYR